MLEALAETPAPLDALESGLLRHEVFVTSINSWVPVAVVESPPLYTPTQVPAGDFNLNCRLFRLVLLPVQVLLSVTLICVTALLTLSVPTLDTKIGIMLGAPAPGVAQLPLAPVKSIVLPMAALKVYTCALTVAENSNKMTIKVRAIKFCLNIALCLSFKILLYCNIIQH